MGNLKTMKSAISSLLFHSLTNAVNLKEAGYETAPYTVVKTDGDFEIRSYPELGLATTADSKDGFNNLFDYISGDNERSQKIDMTTPVFTTEDGMAFVM